MRLIVLVLQSTRLVNEWEKKEKGREEGRDKWKIDREREKQKDNDKKERRRREKERKNEKRERERTVLTSKWIVSVGLRKLSLENYIHFSSITLIVILHASIELFKLEYDEWIFSSDRKIAPDYQVKTVHCIRISLFPTIIHIFSS